MVFHEIWVNDRIRGRLSFVYQVRYTTRARLEYEDGDCVSFYGNDARRRCARLIGRGTWIYIYELYFLAARFVYRI